MSNVYCQFCGAPNPSGSAFCSNCGQPVGQPTDTSAQPYQQPQPAGYQPAANYPNPYDEQPNHNKTLTYALIGLIAVLLLGLVGVGIYWFNKQGEEKQATAEQLEQMEQQRDSLVEAAQAAEQKATEAAQAAEQKAAEAARERAARQSRRPASVPPSQATRVVINGHGVRMRTGPGLQYPFPTTYDGHAYTVSKGTSLPFLGDYDGWYAVEFEGGRYYVSADYSYLR